MDKYLNFLAFMCTVMLFSCSTKIYTTSISRIKGRVVTALKVTVGRECSITAHPSALCDVVKFP